MDFWFPLKNPLKPCSVHDKISWSIDTTNIKITKTITFIEKKNVKNRTFLVSMDVISLDTNTPQNEGIKIICKAYENFYKENLLLHITYRKCLDQSLKKIYSTSMESTSYKPMELQWAQRQQFCLQTFSWHILKQQL